MNSVHLSITLRPKAKEYIAKQAKKRDLSISRYIESRLYDEEDDDYTYTMEELDKESKRLDQEIALGIAKPYTNIHEMIRDLNS